MRTDEACRLIKDISYKPNHSFYARALDDKRIGLEIWATGLMDSDIRFAPYYKSTINRSDVFELDVRFIHEPRELYALVMNCVLEWESHEAREFFTIRSEHKPFHPHTMTGQANWATLMPGIIRDSIEDEVY